MSHRLRVMVGLVALALVAAAAAVGWRLLEEADEGSAESRVLVDDLGCVDGIYANTDFALDGDDGGELIVCRYEKLPLDASSGQSHRLVYSTELSADEARAVRKVIAAAPRGELPFTGCDVAGDGPGEFFLVRTPTQVAHWVYNAECGDNGVLAIGANGKVIHRHDTAAVLEALGSPYGPLGPATG